MLGWIMPDPLATPTIDTLRRLRFTTSPAALANVSVVRMQLAIFSKSGAPSLSHTCSTPPETICGGSGSPMTPVAETNTSCSPQPDCLRADAIVAAFFAMPAAPVKALELPVFTTSTRALPPPDFSAARQRSTSSERVEDIVKMPPAAAPLGKCTTSRSSLTLPL